MPLGERVPVVDALVEHDGARHDLDGWSMACASSFTRGLTRALFSTRSAGFSVMRATSNGVPMAPVGRGRTARTGRPRRLQPVPCPPCVAACRSRPRTSRPSRRLSGWHPLRGTASSVHPKGPSIKVASPGRSIRLGHRPPVGAGLPWQHGRSRPPSQWPSRPRPDGTEDRGVARQRLTRPHAWSDARVPRFTSAVLCRTNSSPAAAPMGQRPRPLASTAASAKSAARRYRPHDSAACSRPSAAACRGLGRRLGQRGHLDG